MIDWRPPQKVDVLMEKSQKLILALLTYAKKNILRVLSLRSC
jgi:hypothetical protein